MFGKVGLGTFPLTGAFTEINSNEANSILDAYFEAGGNYLDVSPTYAFGEIENLLGRYLRNHPRNTFSVSTSCGYIKQNDGYVISGKREDVFKDFEESLERLQLDYVDVYISHIPDPNTPLQETAAALQEILESGRAKRIGVSNVTGEQLELYSASADITVVQNRFSFINRSIDENLRSIMEKIGAKLVAYQVIERGLLSSRGPNINKQNDLRNRKPEFANKNIKWFNEVVRTKLVKLAEKENISMEELVVRWVISDPLVGIAQLGATRSLDAAKIPTYNERLAENVILKLDEIYAEIDETSKGAGFQSARHLLGIADYDVASGSASGK